MLIDKILGIISIVAFVLLFLSLIFAVLDVYYISPFLEDMKEKRNRGLIDK